MTELDLVLDPYHLINLNAGLSHDGMELVFYVKNLFGENVKLLFDREREGRARLVHHVGRPSTVGLVARVSF